MKIIRYPQKEEWNSIVERPHLDVSQLNATVESVLKDVRENGDKAVMAYEEKFDHAQLSSLAVTEAEIEEALTLVSEELMESLQIAHHNISKPVGIFHLESGQINIYSAEFTLRAVILNTVFIINL